MEYAPCEIATAGGQRRQGVKTIPYFCSYAEACSSIAPRSVWRDATAASPGADSTEESGDAQQVLDGPAVAGFGLYLVHKIGMDASLAARTESKDSTQDQRARHGEELRHKEISSAENKTPSSRSRGRFSQNLIRQTLKTGSTGTGCRPRGDTVPRPLSQRCRDCGHSGPRRLFSVRRTGP